MTQIIPNNQQNLNTALPFHRSKVLERSIMPAKYRRAPMPSMIKPAIIIMC